MANWLNKVAKYHKDWVQIAKTLGAKDYAEDIVQESYIKLHMYASEEKLFNNGIISKGYMYFVIRSVFLSYINSKNKINKIQIEEFFKDRDFIEIPQKDFDKFIDNNDLDKEEAFWRLCKKIDQELENWHWYDKSIYKLYRDTELSIRGMAKDTSISPVNIFHTLKKGKDKIRDKFSEDYEDFKNEDYNLI